MAEVGTAGRLGTDAAQRLRLDPISCDGVGMCAHLAPDLIQIDSWGYPIVGDGPLDDRTTRQAKVAVKGCPHKALFID